MRTLGAWVANCHLQQNNIDHHCKAAVWTNDFSDFREKLIAHITPLGYRLLWIEECFPANQYITRHGRQAEIASLARTVHENYLVELGPRTKDTGGKTGLPSYLSIEELEAVEPLDSQASSWPMKDVPDALYEPLFGEPLFGQIEPNSEAHTHVAHSQSIPPIKTYAILDAAKTQFGLTEFRNCAMPFRCLFKGDAAEELKDKAPYLIELEARNDFTRTLFTHNTNMPDEMTTAHLWHKEPAIYIRSRADFYTLWRHFRKFTQIKDPKTGKMHFSRFYDPRVLATYLTGIQHWDARIYDLFYPLNTPGITYIVSITRDDTLKFSPSEEVLALCQNTPRTPLNEKDWEALQGDLVHKRAQIIAADLRRLFPKVITQNKEKLIENIVQSINKTKAQGIVKNEHLFYFATWHILYGLNHEEADKDGKLRKIMQSTLTEDKKFNQYKARIEQMKVV